MSVAKRIGQYEIVELLGRGAMGEVYKAVDSKMFGRLVAVKVLSERLSRNEQALARFKREVEVAAKLEHPNIVTIHDRGELDDRHYFVMEFIDGTDLAAIIEERQSHKLEELLSIACQTCEAIEFAHADGVIHRDIKPSNVMITRRGGQAHAKLVDFGIVHVERSNLTRSQTQPGTFSYMSPEQLRNDDVDHRSDLFSLGIVLYETFTGAHPFDAASEALTTQKILSDEPQPPKQLEASIPSSLESLILKLLEKDPRQRPQTTGEVTAALDEARRRYMSRGVSDAGDYSNVADLTRPMVENLVAFGRKKEAEGDLDAALLAYEKAATLAPEVDRLERKIHKLRHSIESEKKLREHLEHVREALEAGDYDAAEQHRKEAWILSPESVRVAELEAAIREARASPAEPPAASSEVDEILEGSQRQMDEGDLNGARHKLVDAIRRFPDDVKARLALDRLMQVVGWGGDYVGYRAAIADARQALGRDDFTAARSACDRAGQAWPGDEEWQPLAGEIDARRDGKLGALLDQAQATIREAEACGEDEGRGLELLAGASETLERARDLGADEARLAAPAKAADGLKAELLARQKQREAQEQDKHRRAEDGLARADDVLEKARRLEAEGPPAAARAIEAYESGRTLLAQVQAAEPGNPDAAERLAEIDAAIRRVGRSLEEREQRARELEELLNGARGALERAGDVAEATSAGLGDARRGLAEGRKLVERALKLDGASAVARELLERIEDRETALERRKRILDTLEGGLDRGRAVMARAQKLVVSESIEELRSGEKMCRDAVEAFRGVLAVEDDHAEAVEALRNLEVLGEHFNSEIEGRARADDEARAREERVRSALEQAVSNLDEAESAADGDEAALKRGVEQCRAASALLDRVQADDPGNEQGRRQGERGRHLEQELVSRLERARTEAAERKTEAEAPSPVEPEPVAPVAEIEPGEPEKAAPEVSKSRRQRELRKAKSHLDEARDLIERGDPVEAREILEELEEACRERTWLGELLPEVERLRETLAPAPAPRNRVPLIAAAIAVPIVLIAGIWIVVRMLSPDSEPVSPAVAEPPLERVEVNDPWQPVDPPTTEPADEPVVDEAQARPPDVPADSETVADVVADVPPVVSGPPGGPPETVIDDTQPPVDDAWEGTGFAKSLRGKVADVDRALAEADAKIGREPLPQIIRRLEQTRSAVSRFIAENSSMQLDILPARLQQLDRKLGSLRYSRDVGALEDRLGQAKTSVSGAIGSLDDAEIAGIERLLQETRTFVAANSSRDPAALSRLIREIETRLPAHKIPANWMGFLGFACDPVSGRRAAGLTVTARHARGAPVQVSAITGAGGEFKLILPAAVEQPNSRGRFFIVVANSQGEEQSFDGGGMGFQAYQDGQDRQIDVTGTLCPGSN